jgi:hypothetical protein
MKCTRCHEVKLDCTIHCKRLNKDGTTYIRYICRECRRTRWAKNRPVQNKSAYRSPVSPTPPKPHLHYNWKIDFNSPSPSKAIVSMPAPVKYSSKMAQFVAEGRQKNLGIMLKYK